MVSGECVVRMTDIRTRIAGQIVHKSVNLCVHRGEVLGLIGASGAGKTVLLREMIGLQQPQSGEVRVFGESIENNSTEARRRLRGRWGVLFQQGALFSAFTVFDNIALPLREQQVLDQGTIRDLVRLKLAMVGLKPTDAWRMPAELSGGMIKRAALARALALEPELLLLDEPTAGLDPIASGAFVDLVRALGGELGLTVVMVTHDLDTLASLCDRIAVLADQTLITVGPLEAVMAFDHPFTQSFFNSLREQRRSVVDNSK